MYILFPITLAPIDVVGRYLTVSETHLFCIGRSHTILSLLHVHLPADLDDWSGLNRSFFHNTQTYYDYTSTF